MLKGLVLCGGRSTRMQEDKSQIAYHGLPQWEYLYQLLQSVVSEVYLSCREDQTQFSGKPVIVDSVNAGGPSAGLLSAYALQPETSWLVLACDLPLISRQSLEVLIASRQANKDATAFISPADRLPEPLIAIWEPQGLAKLKLFVEGGRNCPRKSLLQGDIFQLENPFATEQFNANTPEEKAAAMDYIG